MATKKPAGKPYTIYSDNLKMNTAPLPDVSDFAPVSIVGRGFGPRPAPTNTQESLTLDAAMQRLENNRKI